MLISNKKVPNRKPLYLTIFKLFLAVSLLSFAFSYKEEFLEILDNVYESTSSRYLEKLTVKQINVTGNSKLSSEEIIKISGMQLGEATLKADVLKAKEYLEGQAWMEQLRRMREMQYAYHKKFFHGLYFFLVLVIACLLWDSPLSLALVPFLVITAGTQSCFYLHLLIVTGKQIGRAHV